jgi:CelD/BcsL family acetyltransferase involved in cellulose biosynthesis
VNSVSTGWDRVDSLRELKGSWNSFLLASSTPDFFRSWEWLDAWLAVFGAGKRPCILAYYDRDGLAGLAPLCSTSFFGLERITFLGAGVSDRHGFIVRPGKEDAFSRGLFQALDEHTGWQLCDLRELPADDPISQRLHASLSPRMTQVSLQSKLPYLTLPTTWEEFLGGYSKKRRDKIKYYPRMLSRDYQWSIEEADQGNLQDRLDTLASLNVHRWLRKGVPSSFLQPGFRLFHALVAKSLLGRALRLYTLLVDGRPVAFLYGYSFGKRFSFYLCAQDDRFSRYGLGFILQVEAIRRAIEEGCLAFDFLRGLEDYKMHWKPQVAVNQRLLVRRGGWGSRIGASLIWAEHGLEQGIKRKAKRI